MATKVMMPKLGAQMEEGTIVSWLVEEGEAIEEGDPLAEIQTDKITMEIEAETTGIVLKKLYEKDSIVPVQQTIAFIGEEGENVEDVEVSQNKSEATLEADNQMSEAAGKETEPVETTNKIRRTPAARNLAQEKQIDLAQVKGSGPLGRIHQADVEEVMKEAKATPLAKKVAENQNINLQDIEGSGVNGKIHRDDLLAQTTSNEFDNACNGSIEKSYPFKGMRKIIADRMTESANSGPHVTLDVEIDVTEVVSLRKKLLPVIEEAEGLRVSYNDILIKATAAALKKHPNINAELRGDKIIHHIDVHIGMAVAVDGGLLVPVIRHADQKGLARIARDAKSIGNKARENKLLQDDLAGSTFTISNLGMFAVDHFNPIINRPNSAILGVGRIQKKPAVFSDEIQIRSMMGLSLSFDHRIIDGAPAAAFITELKDLLENPYKLMV
ncbi:dihydrolipoamide acetyltransferase [Oceanobacillus oncorhynchi subsp. oncorhynchi]|uniref:dihydrolipoamide acetyltransferase family protein n=1 Tax=Oceanobacillus oncorhynchi TaxID=545501 RepID=UPI0031CE987D